MDTLCAVFIVTTQLPVPLHAPPQPEKVEPLPGAAVSVTWVPGANVALHVVVGQLIPEGELETVPFPVTVVDKASPAFTSKTTPPLLELPPCVVVP
jgi:hypothetical protein